MSFGASPSDIIIVVTFCRALYRKCREAGGEYDEISREIRGLHTVLKHLKYEVEDQDSILNRDRSTWSRQLAPIIGDCDFTLRTLDEVLQKYGRLAANNTSPSTSRVLWDKVRFGSNEMDQLGSLRVKLISHKTSLTLFLDTIQLRQSGQMATTLNTHGDQLDIILDKVDNIAAKMGQRSGSLMTAYENDDQEVWKQFRRELVAEGFSSDVLQQHKDVLRAYIREIEEQGLLVDDEPPASPVPPQSEGINPARWAESVASSESVPPSSNSMDSQAHDGGGKERVRQEENMKFPVSMKLERPQPETKKDGDFQKLLKLPTPDSPALQVYPVLTQQQPLLNPAGLVTSAPSEHIAPIQHPSPRTSASSQLIASESMERNTAIQRRPSPVPPRLITSESRHSRYSKTTGSDDDSDSEQSARRSSSPSNAVIIRTSDLTAPEMSLQVYPSTSPSSFRSNSSFEPQNSSLSIPHRSKTQSSSQIGASPSASPSRTSSMPIPIPTSSPRLTAAPRAEPFVLAPDSKGNVIPPDAKWTKIKRSLVSPEVLQKDGRRYEARPDFVAVLGVLTRKEIQDYVFRSHELREARWRRTHPSAPPPPQPARPKPRQRKPERKSASSSSSSSDTSSDSSSESDHGRHRRSHRRHRDRRPHHHHKHYSYQSTPASASDSPSTKKQVAFTSPRDNQVPTLPIPSPRYANTYPVMSSRRDRIREKIEDKREESGRRIRSSPSSKRHTRDGYSRLPDADKNKDIDREKVALEKKRRWKENLTAASLGGAAVSLLNVLAEAAEAL